MNAGGLDGVTNWNAIGGGALAVDEAVTGGPGRAVIEVTGVGAVGGVVGIASDTVPIVAAPLVEAFGRYAASQGAWSLQVEWRSGAAVLAQAPVTFAAAPVTAAKRGLPTTFAWAYSRLQAPGGADGMRLLATTTLAAAGAYSLALLKPYLGLAPADPRPTRWDPGSHANPDLQLQVWPSDLAPFRSDQLPTPIANGKAWAGDAGIPVRESLYAGVHHEFRGQMRLSSEQFDVLDAFYDSTQDAEFYVVRPDTDQLCVAEWLADGAPKPASLAGPWTIAEAGLHLRVA